MSGQPQRKLGSTWYSLISTNFQSVTPFRTETKGESRAANNAVSASPPLANGKVGMEPLESHVDAEASEPEHDLVSSSSQSSLASACSGTWSECYGPLPQPPLPQPRVIELTGDGTLRMRAPASHSLDSLASTAGGADGSGESWTQEEAESRSDFSASDDDSSSFGKCPTNFVRSFDRRIRTRDRHGGDLKVLSALRAQHKHRDRESQRSALSKRDPQATERERVLPEVPVAVADGRSSGDRDERRRVSMVWSPSYSEASSDTQDLCSPVSDDVFWASYGSHAQQEAGFGHGGEWRPSPPERRRSSVSLESINEASSYLDLGFPENGDAEALIPRATPAEGPKPKEVGGLSFLSRLSKTVSTKRKYGKSFKGHGFPGSDRKASEVDLAFRESLESIVEGGVEKSFERKPLCARTSSMGSFDSATHHATRPLEGADTASEAKASPHTHRTKSFVPVNPTEERERISVRELVRSFVVKDSGSGLVVTHCKGEKPIPQPRLNKSPGTPPLRIKSLQESRYDGESCGSQPLPNGRVVSGSPQERSQTHSRSSSGSFWPQLFSGGKSQEEKAPPSSGKHAPSKQQDPSGAHRQRSHTFTVAGSKAAPTVNGTRNPGQASPSGGRTSPRRLPQIPRQDANKPSQQPQPTVRTSSQQCPSAALRSSSPHLAESAPRSLASQAVGANSDSLGDGLKTGTPPPKRSKFLSTFGFGPESASKKIDSDKGMARSGKGGKEKTPNEWNVLYTNSPAGPSSRIRRVGAIKKPEEMDNKSAVCDLDTLSKEQSSIKGTNMGAIPKSSYLNKTFHIMNRDDYKKNESKISEAEERNSDKESQQGSQGSSKSPAKAARKLGKRVLERSISVPLWTRLSGQDSGNAQNPESDEDLNVSDPNSHSEVQASVASKEETTKTKVAHTKSSPANFPRKIQHKRTSSYDVAKTFKDDMQVFPPERSASHDNLAKLKDKDPLEMPVLAVEFASPESPPQMEFKSLRTGEVPPEGLGQKGAVKHRSCNNIIDIGEEPTVQVSPKFARTFKDSKLISTSAFCLTNSVMKKASAVVRREASPASFFLPGEEPPSSLEHTPSLSSVANGETPHMFYISPYELTTHVRDKQTLQRLTGLFHGQTSDPKMDSLVQQLDLYSRQGIPRQPHLLTCQTYHSDEELLVEDSWRTLVESHDRLDDRQEQQQSAIWELVETEATYIHMLKVITDLFLACLCNLQNESLLCEIDTDKLFSNIQEIYAANLTFWREHVVKMLEEARSSRQPLDPTLLSDAFYKFDELFHPYTRYCLDQSLCQQYCKEKDHDNEYFKMYLAWCETQKECNRLRLMDILVQPMQRLTKYSLLLKAIAKKTNLEDHRISLQDMISHVESFVSNVNSALRHKHEQERLRDIAKRIEAYDAVEAKDDELEKVVRTYSDLNLTQPMPGCPEHLPRHILHHGDLRLRDPHTKMDVHVFLFTDLLLITKVTQRKAEKVKVIRPPYHVERLVLVDLKDCTSIGIVSVNEWNVAVAAFTLQCPDQRTHRTWHDALKRAKEQYKEAQQARDVLVYDDMSCVGHLVPRSPRPGSSRASRVSSLAHSHSGSIDLNDPSPGSTHHPPSVDLSEKQDSKDTTIHKRLSWNYGQGPPPSSRDLGNEQGKLGRQKHAMKSISCESMHSSSGVSSTSSLHRSMGSELEALENIDDNELEDGEGTVVDLTVSDCTSLKISPHISTTYICHDTDITLGVCSQYITQPNNTTEPTEGCENLVKIDVSETDPGISSVQITVTEGASSSSSNLSSTTSSSDGAPGKTDGLRMREILLNDASIEASDV